MAVFKVKDLYKANVDPANASFESTDTLSKLKSSATSNQIVVYNDVSDTWELADNETGSDTLSTLGQSASDGQIAKYSTGSGEWVLTYSSGAEPYATVNDLPLINVQTGTIAFVTETNRMYVWKGSATTGTWYEIAYVNESPVVTQGVSETAYEVPQTGDAITVTLAAYDPEGLPIQWDFQETDADDIIVVTNNNDGSFSIAGDPDAIANSRSGTATVSFKISDGKNLTSETGQFVLTFASNIRTEPAIISTLTATGNLLNPLLCALSGTTLFVGTTNNVIVAVDVSDPLFPTEIGNVSLPNSDALQVDGDKMLVVGNTLFVSHLFNITAIDITDPTNMSVIGNYRNTGILSNFTHIAYRASDQVLFTSGGTADDFSAFDVSDPTNIQLISSLAVSAIDDMRAVAVNETTAYVWSDDDKRIVVIDVSNTASMSVLTTIAVSEFSSNIGGFDAKLNGDYLYVSGRQKLLVYDVATSFPTPTLVGQADILSFGHDFVLDGDYIYITGQQSELGSTDGTGTFTVVNISDPTNPLVSAELNDATLSAARNIAYADDNAYLVSAGGSDVPKIAVIG